MLSGKYKKKKLIFEKVPVLTGSSFATERVTGTDITSAYHYHPEPELTLIASGSGRALIGTEWIGFSSGDLMLIGGNVPHIFVFVPDTICGNEADVLKITRNFMLGPLECVPEFSGIRTLFRLANTGLFFPETRGMTERFGEILNCGVTERFLWICHLLQSLSHLPFRRVNATGRTPFLSQLYDREKIESALSYLQRNFKRKITLKEAAAESGMDPESFRKFFRKSLRMSFTDYLLELRLAMACKLLRETSCSILEVAWNSGFFNLSNFNRIFRSRQGISPREYRKL